VTVLAGPTAPPEPVDWAMAGRLAARLAGTDLVHRSYAGAAVRADVTELVELAAPVVEAETGLALHRPFPVETLTRREWCERNLVLTRRMLAPLTDRLAARLARSPAAPVGRRVAAGELGLVLGYASQRVLGQYDPFRDTDTGHRSDPGAAVDGDGAGVGAMYVVAANVVATEQRLGLPSRAFRLWLVAHELTHRAQFAGVPWLRDHFRELVERVVRALDLDPGAIVAAAGRALRYLRRAEPVPESGPLGVLVTDTQREALEGIQALMALLEGHGNFVMRRVGAALVPGSERIGAALAARRAAGGIQGLVARLAGLEMKLRQYGLGERFWDTVTREAGDAALRRPWAAPGWLPTLAELDDPRRWLRRVDSLPGPPAVPGPAR